MLPEENRLRGKENFERVKKEGKIFQGKHLGVVVYKRKDEDPPRFGIIASTKVSKRAVDRNKVKRVFRKILTEEMENIRLGFDFLLLAKKNSLEAGFDNLKKGVKDILRKSKTLK